MAIKTANDSQSLATRIRVQDFTALGMYLPNPDPVLRKLGQANSAYKDLRADAVVGGLIRRRKSAVKSLVPTLDRGRSPARVFRAVEEMLEGLDMQRLIGQILDAPLFGYQPLEVTWLPENGRHRPIVESKPPEWFVFDDENQLRLLTKANPEGERVPEGRFLLARQDDNYQNPYGFADLSMVFWPATFKRGGLRFWVEFTEKFGQPWLVGKLPRSAAPEEYDDMLADLTAMIRDAVAAIPDDSSVEIKEAGGKTASAQVFEMLLRYCKSEISIALLGQDQTTEADANKASAVAGQEVTEDIRDGDKSIVVSTIQCLIDWFVERNFGEVVTPDWSMNEPERVEEKRKAQSEIDEKHSHAGVRFSKNYYVKTYGYEEDDIEDISQPAPNPIDRRNNNNTPVAGTEASFAEGADLPPHPGDLLAGRLGVEARDAHKDWLDQIRQIVDESANAGESLEQLRDRVLNAYGDLDSGKMADVMGFAFSAANLAGVSDVAEEAAQI